MPLNNRILIQLKLEKIKPMETEFLVFTNPRKFAWIASTFKLVRQEDHTQLYRFIMSFDNIPENRYEADQVPSNDVMPIRWAFPEDVARQIEKAEKVMESSADPEAKEAIGMAKRGLSISSPNESFLIFTNSSIVSLANSRLSNTH